MENLDRAKELAKRAIKLCNDCNYSLNTVIWAMFKDLDRDLQKQISFELQKLMEKPSEIK